MKTVTARRIEWTIYLLAALAFMATATGATNAKADPHWGRGHWDNDDRGRWDDHPGRHRGHHKKWRDDDDDVTIINQYPAYYGGTRTVVVREPQPVYVAPPVVYETPQPVYRTNRVSCAQNLPVESIVTGIGGGILGNQFGKGSGRTAAVIGGTLVGAMLGQQFAGYDRDCAYQTFEYAPAGRPVAWGGDAERYQFVPQPVYQNNYGQYCREFQADAWVGGRRQQTYGTACRQPDGDWKVVQAD